MFCLALRGPAWERLIFGGGTRGRNQNSPIGQSGKPPRRVCWPAARQLGYDGQLCRPPAVSRALQEKPQAGRLFLPMGAFHGAA